MRLAAAGAAITGLCCGPVQPVATAMRGAVLLVAVVAALPVAEPQQLAAVVVATEPRPLQIRTA